MTDTNATLVIKVIEHNTNNNAWAGEERIQFSAVVKSREGIATFYPNLIATGIDTVNDDGYGTLEADTVTVINLDDPSDNLNRCEYAGALVAATIAFDEVTRSTGVTIDGYKGEGITVDWQSGYDCYDITVTTPEWVRDSFKAGTWVKVGTDETVG